MKASALAHGAFWAGVLLIVALGSALHGAARQALDATLWLAHTNEVLAAVAAVDEHLSRAESAQRGFLLSDHEGFLAERDTALKNVDSALARLKTTLTADNAAQTARLPRLQALILERRALLNQQIANRRAGDRIMDGDVVLAGQQLTNTISAITHDIQREEQRLLLMHQANVKAQYDRAIQLLYVAIGLGVLVLVPAYAGFIVQSRARQHVEARMLDMTESVPGAIFRARANRRGVWHYEFVSSNVTLLHAVDRDTALRDAAAVLQTVHPDDRAALLAAVRGASDTLTHLDHEYRVVQADGSVKWVRSSAAPRREPDGTTVWNGHWADITTQKMLERALHDAKEEADTANRAKSTFLAVMSHEIRTPLNGVLGMLELLGLSNLDKDQRTTLNVVRESGRALQRIIDDILDFSKIEAGRLEIAPVPSSIAEIVAATRNLYAGNASSKGLLLRTYVDPRLSPALLVDALRLRQILNNFLSNAVKFTSHGDIDIRAELVERSGERETVRFSVRDRGIGIAPEARQRLFQPFTQASAETTRGFGGTGLGLTICRRLSDMMGGTITVDSAPGKGTTMALTVTLPIADSRKLVHLDARVDTSAQPDEGAASRPAPSVPEAEREGTLVLLVDDHPINRMLVCRQANLLGYAAETAENGVEALTKWKSGRYAAVLTDINMPEMDGYTLARTIREIESSQKRTRTPIIACTANALRGEADKCFEAGMDDYLAKPVHLRELGAKLRQWLPLGAAAAASNEAAADSAMPLDRSILAEISSGVAEDERAILREFWRVNSEDVAALQKAVAENRAREIIRTAHRMKGASRMIGAVDLANVCARIEQAGRSEDLAAVRQNMRALAAELERLERHIEPRNNDARLPIAQTSKERG